MPRGIELCHTRAGAPQLESVADHLNVLLDEERRFLIEALAESAERLGPLVAELPQA